MSEIIDRLESRIIRHFERHSSSRAVGAASLAGVLSIGTALLILSFTSSLLYALIGFALVGAVSIHFAISFMVPSVEELTASQTLICGAVRNPERIKRFDADSVKLADKDGNARELNKLELKVWRVMVVPVLVNQQKKVGQIEKIVVKDDSVSEAERQEIEERRRELREAERKIESERRRIEGQNRRIEEKMAEMSQAEENVADLNAKSHEVDEEVLEKLKKEQEEKIAAREKEIAELQKALEDERADLEERAAYVTTVEESLVERMNELTSREAEVEQGEINAGIRPD